MSCTDAKLVYTSPAIAIGSPNASGDFVVSTPSSGATAFTPSAIGYYAWTATYASGDLNNGSSGPTACGDSTEVGLVVKASPSIGTTPSAGGTVGVTLTDSASLSNGVSPTGTILFSLFPPSDGTCAGSAVYTATVTVNGNASYSTTSASSTTGSNVTTAVGTYHWTAFYSGDGKNNTASSACAA